MLYCSPRHGIVKLSALFYLVLPMIYSGVTFPVLAHCRTKLQCRSPSTVSPPLPRPGGHKSAAGWEMGTSWHSSCLHCRGARQQCQLKSCSHPSVHGGETFLPWHLLTLMGGMPSDGKPVSVGTRDGGSGCVWAAAGVAPTSPELAGRGSSPAGWWVSPPSQRGGTMNGGIPGCGR